MGLGIDEELRFEQLNAVAVVEAPRLERLVRLLRCCLSFSGVTGGIMVRGVRDDVDAMLSRHMCVSGSATCPFANKRGEGKREPDKKQKGFLFGKSVDS
jgi:hypothetical protein